MPPTRATPPGNGPEQTHVDGVHLQVTRDTDRPRKIAGREAVAKRRAQPIPCICQDAGEAHAGRDHAIDLSKCDLRLGRAVQYSTATPARFNRARSLFQLSGRKRRNATITGTSSRASVSDTSVWQLAFLPSAEAYCQATPTECLPFFGTAVSSITNTASLPPTSLSAWTSSSFSNGAASQTPAATKWCN